MIVDTGNSAVRRVGADGTISAVAGAPSLVKTDFELGRAYDSATLAFNSPGCIVLPPDGQPVVTTRRQIMRVGEDGRTRVIAGRPAVGDKPDFGVIMSASAAPMAGKDMSFVSLSGIAAGLNGDLFVAEAAQQIIYKLSGAAGDSPELVPYVGRTATEVFAAGVFGVAPPAEGTARGITLNMPTGLCTDPAGNLYFAEVGTAFGARYASLLGGAPIDFTAMAKAPARVRKVTPDGRVTTIVGPGGRYFTDPDAEDALSLPTGLAYAPDGRLAILDGNANLIRILPAGSF